MFRNAFLTLAAGFGFVLCQQPLSALPAFNWDQKTYYPHAETQLASLTPAQITQLNTYDSQYNPQFVYQSNPGGAGVNQADMDWVASRPAYFALSRDPGTGVLSGRGIVIYGQGDGFQPDLSQPATSYDFTYTCQKLTDIYWRSNSAQSPQIVQVYSDLIEHYLDQNYLPGGQAAPWLSGGYVWRNHGWFPMRMAHVLTPQVRDLLGMSMYYVSCGWNLSSASPYVSTDDFYNIVNTAFCGARLISNGPAKWQLLALARRGMDLSIYSLMPLDGSIIHHAGHHTHYAAYSFDNTIMHHLRFSYAGIVNPATTPEAIKRFRKAALAWSFATTGGLNPAHQNMRSALPSASSIGDGGWGHGVGWAYKASQLKSYYDGSPIAGDLEMAYAAIAKLAPGSTNLPVEWRSITPPATPDRTSPTYTGMLLGHYSHTTNGTSIHRGPGHWYASVRSQHGNYRGGEAYDGMGLPDHFNRMSMQSALMLITTGKQGRKPNEVDSGVALEGWDYYYYPNVTCGDGNQGDLLYWKTPAYFGGGGAPMGSANLRESGLWMAQSGTRKSGFFLGNRIVMATTDINGAGQHTGLIQYAHTDAAAEPLVVDGTSLTQDGDSILSAGGNHKLVDPQGNGYLVHPGASTAQIRTRRGNQEWTYALPSQYIGSGSAPSFTQSWEFLARWNEFRPTSRNYSRVWFDHGSNAANQSLEYTVLVKPQAGELDAYATAMANPSTAPVVVTKNSNVHRYFDRATGTYAAAVFNPAEAINQGSVLSVNRAAAYLWRRDGDLMNLSVSCSDWGNPFEVTLSGVWTFESGEDTGTVTVTTSGGNTVVSMPMISETPQRVVLRSQSATQWAGLTSTVDVATAHTSFSVNLNSAGIGTSPSYSIIGGNGSGLFAISSSQLTATRAFARTDLNPPTVLVQASQGATVLGTIAVTVTLTDNANLAATKDTDGDGFRDGFETTSGTDPNDAASHPTTALRAYWNFDQSGDMTPYDVVGGVQGWLAGGAALSAPTSGRSGGAGDRGLDLGSSGNGPAYRVAQPEFLRRVAAGNKMTLSFWQKLDSATLYNMFSFFAVSPASASQRGISCVSPWTDNIHYFDAGGTAVANRVSGTASATLTQWNHFALVKDGGTMQLWINGTLVKSETGKAALFSDFTELFIGSGNGANSSIRGDIDDFAVFSKPLDSTQIASLVSGTSPLAITVLGNQPPAITTTTLSVPENVAGGSAVGTVVATDADGPGALTWSIVGTALADTFFINASTGVISATAGASINYEVRTSYLLNVVARDAMGASTTKVIQINVTNVNEAPVATGFDAGILDTLAVGSTVGTVTSTDQDVGQSRSWSITAGNTGGAFAVNATTGVVTVAQVLNGSSTPTYNLTLTITDAGGLSHSDQVVVNVFGMSGITTDSDSDGFSNAFEVSRGSDPNNAASLPSTVLAAYWNFDQSGAPATFSDIVRGLSGQPFSGAALSTAGSGRTGGSSDRAVDFGNSGSGPRLEVTSVAWLNQLAATDKITISVWQKYNSRTGYATPFYGVSPSSAAGQRGMSGHTPWSDNYVFFDCGGTAAANRTSYGPVGYWRDIWFHSAFVKNGGTTQIWINGQLLSTQTGKAALKTDFTKFIMGADSGGGGAIRGVMDDFAIFRTALTSSQISALNGGLSPLMIDAIESNLPPVITTASLGVSEDANGGSVVGTLVATDADGPAPITWTLSGVSGLFTLNPATGVISTAETATFDREVTASYTATVTATDAYEKTSSRQITINVENVNEDPSAVGFETLIYDTAAVGTVIGTATATDPDIGDTITWSITAGNPGGAFAIHAATGVVTVAQTLDAVTTPFHNLTVTATDVGGATSDASVQVRVFGMGGITTDSDGDGFSNAFEIARFSDPNNASSKPTSLLAAYWNFDQSGSPATFSDTVRSLQAQPFSVAALSAAGTGRSGSTLDRAVDFGTAGTTSRLEVASVAWLNQVTTANNITISFWQKLNTVVNNHPFYAVSPSSSASYRGIAAHTPHGGIVYFDTGGAAATNRINVNQPSGMNWTQWSHVAFVRNGGTAQIWVNGVLLKSESGKTALKSDITKLLIGAGVDGSLNPVSSVTGLIDDFAVFNAPLTSVQISGLAAGASPLSLDELALPAPLPLAGIAQWRQLNFATAGEDDRSASLADPDADGLVNLMEYTLGTLPNSPSAFVAKAGKAAIGGEDHLTLTFDCGGPIADSRLRFEVSDSLAGPWASYSPFEPEHQISVTPVPSAPGVSTYVVFDPVPMSSSPRRFIRLKASSSQP